MANYSSLTRREQVFAYLKTRLNQWVDGPELANEMVGGSEGLKRLRELRQELKGGGRYEIEMRGHPRTDLDIFQYRLTERVPVRSVYAAPAPAVSVASAEPVSQERPREPQQSPARRSDFHLGYDPTSGRYLAVVDATPSEDPPPLPGQIDMGVPEADLHKYTVKPTKLELGKSIMCPMCHGIHRALKERDPVTGKAHKSSRVIGYEELTRDPRKPSLACPRCNGFGLIPVEGAS